MPYGLVVYTQRKSKSVRNRADGEHGADDSEVAVPSLGTGARKAHPACLYRFIK